MGLERGSDDDSKTGGVDEEAAAAGFVSRDESRRGGGGGLEIEVEVEATGVDAAFSSCIGGGTLTLLLEV